MIENGYINEHEKKVRNNSEICEYNMIKLSIHNIKKHFTIQMTSVGIINCRFEKKSLRFLSYSSYKNEV